MTRVTARVKGTLVPGIGDVPAGPPGPPHRPPSAAPDERAAGTSSAPSVQPAPPIGVGGTELGGLVAPQRPRTGSVEFSVVSPNLTLLGMRGDNSLLVRGTDADITELKTLIRLMDVPLKQLSVRIVTGKLTAEGHGMNGAPIRLSDATSEGRFEATVIPRINGDAAIDLEVEGTLTTPQGTFPLKSRVRLLHDQTGDLVSIGEPERLVRVSIRASILPDPVEQGGNP